MGTINYRLVSKIGLALMAIAFIFCTAETYYFGSNLLPESKAELTCDFISAFLLGIGGGLYGLCAIVALRRMSKEIKQLRDELKSEHGSGSILNEKIFHKN